jgi:uncharacterized protein
MRSLFDVNVLIALLDKDHVHHVKVHSWWVTESVNGWASCPITENGVVRIMSNASYPGKILTSEEVLRGLSVLIQNTDHVFWPDSVSLLGDQIDRATLTSSRVTDAYLLALALERGGRVVTLDDKMPTSAIRNFPRGQLHVLR